MGDFIFAVIPLVYVIWSMTRKNSTPSHKALPIAAVMTYGIYLLWFRHDITEVHATVIAGVISSLTPILIIWGAIFLFAIQERSGALDIIRKWLFSVSSNRVAQAMIIGWAFTFLIEGASGFGTPAALAAPLLVGLGFKPVPVAVFCLINNSVPVSFGAVGTPTWFGFSDLTHLTNSDMINIGLQSSILHTGAALVIPVISLSLLVGWNVAKRNLLFVYLSILSTVIPYILISSMSYEFPSLVGGFIGLLVTVFLASRKIGLHSDDFIESDSKEEQSSNVKIGTLIKALFPLWGTIVVLILTRIPALGIKGVLTSSATLFDIQLGSFGLFKVTESLSIVLQSILNTKIAASVKLLYIPAIIPFFIIGIVTALLFKQSFSDIGDVFSVSAKKMQRPIITLIAALVFVNIMMYGNDKSATMIIGTVMASSLGGMWQFAASYLGALGSFFSGSNTISNLTFARIQSTIALQSGLNEVNILAMQSVGGAMGNMVCINNIVAVCSVLGLSRDEGTILKKTVLPMVLYGVIVGVMSLGISFIL